MNQEDATSLAWHRVHSRRIRLEKEEAGLSTGFVLFGFESAESDPVSRIELHRVFAVGPGRLVDHERIEDLVVVVVETRIDPVKFPELLERVGNHV